MSPAGTWIGAASARSRAQPLHLRPDRYVGLICRNVQTRLGRLGGHRVAATLLAIAGIDRLRLPVNDMSILPREHMVPVVCQGIVGVTVRAGDDRTIELVSSFNDPTAWAAAQAERALLRVLDGSGCTPDRGLRPPAPGERASSHGNGRPT